jgi:predicted ATPase
MRCPSCNTHNPEERRFCLNCGAPLSNCPHCGFHNEPPAKFCGGCGRALVAAETDPETAAAPPVPAAGSSAQEGERRQVTVMFCDLVGSTSLSNTLDPEDLRDVIRGFQDVATDSIERHGGFIARYMGDGILVYFGYPRAHEDDAERALRTALEVVAAVQRLHPLPDVRLQARVGIATGLAIVGDLIGKGVSREEAVVGPTPNLAARLQGLAQPGGVVISAETRAIVANLFTCEDLGQYRLKGFDAPVRAWSVLDECRVDSRFEAIRPSFERVPLIGRTSELEQLCAAWERACGGEGQVVTLRGGPGIGKSRLTQAMRAQVAAGPHVVLRYYCAPRFQNTAFYPITDQLRHAAGLRRDDPADVCLDKLERLLSLAAPASEVTEMVRYIAPLLSIPLGERYPPIAAAPERQRERLFALLVAQLVGLAGDKPVLMLFEDLHWIDPTSLQLLEQLVREIVALPVLLLATSREEFEPPWDGRPGSSIIQLTQLDRTGSLQIISNLTGGRLLPDEVVDQILAKSDGVPLYVEELTKTLLESGLLREEADAYVLTGPLPSFAVPSTLQDSLMARLDRLGEAKEVAQVGAAIGRHFSVDLLSAVCRLPDSRLRPAIKRLMDSDLVECRRHDGDAVCGFKHVLLQEAAQATMLRRSRQHLHGRIAAELERRSVQGAQQSPELLAHHFAMARMQEKAIPYWQQAGALASSRAAYTEAISHFRAAVDLLTELPRSPTRDQLELGIRVNLGLCLSAARGYAAPEVEDSYQIARELCHRLGDSVDLYPVLRGLCTFYIVRAQLPTARQLAEQCLRLGEQSQDPVHLIEGNTALGYTLFFMGEIAQSEPLLAESVAIYRRRDGQRLQYPTTQDPAISDLSLLAMVAWMHGKDADSASRSRQALEIANQLKRPFDLAYALCFAAMLHNMRREPEAAAAHAAQAIELSSEYGFDIWLAAGTLQGAIARGALGETAEAIALLEGTLAVWRQAGAGLNQSFFLAGLAESYRRAGDVEAALNAVEQAIEHADRHDEHFYDAVLYRLRGEMRLEAGGDLTEPGLADLSRALEVARAQGARLFALDAVTSLHRASLRLSQSSACGHELDALQRELALTCAGCVSVRNAQALLAGTGAAA